MLLFVVVLQLIFISVNFYFSFVLNSLAYITIPKNNRNIKINWDKKLTTTYIYRSVIEILKYTSTSRDPCLWYGMHVHWGLQSLVWEARHQCRIKTAKNLD